MATDLERREELARQAVSQITAWLYGTLMKPHPDLGRRGAVCPFLDQATKMGRVSLSVVHVESYADVGRLAAVATEALRRIRSAKDGESAYESALFLPVGADDEVLIQCVTEVQRRLKTEAVEGGCMVGEFFPAHPMPGIHNAAYRPLDSPRPLLGMRTMVDTDIHFLGQPTIPANELRHGIEAWYGFFGATASPPLMALYRRARDVVDRQ